MITYTVTTFDSKTQKQVKTQHQIDPCGGDKEVEACTRDLSLNPAVSQIQVNNGD